MGAGRAVRRRSGQDKRRASLPDRPRADLRHPGRRPFLHRAARPDVEAGFTVEVALKDEFSGELQLRLCSVGTHFTLAL